MVLHIMVLDKFMVPFIDFIRARFNVDDHKFVFVTSEKYLFGLTPTHEAEFLHTDNDIQLLESYIYQSKKVILHGLWRDKVDALLVKNKEILGKCYWVLWGGDFYFPAKHSEARKAVIQGVGFLVTANTGDVEYVRQNYNASGQHVNCISYLSNVFYDVEIEGNSTQFINVQVGNSAAINNNHKQVFESLAQLNNNKIKVFCPLSYGSRTNAEEVSRIGKKIFGSRFVPLMDFWDFNEYQKFLATMDYAIFDAKRQQGFSNSLYLVGMGKKVFINECSNIHQYFSGFGIQVYNSAHIDISPLDNDVKCQNMKLVRKYFGEQRLLESLSEWIN
ncbi:MAG: hypothetical protein CL578_23550 [Alteromonadaceae bacterium]|nr:hypothetical protein [Alteromonadaceae bacterium]